MFTTCYRCGDEGHVRAQCPQGAPAPAPANGLPPSPDHHAASYVDDVGLLRRPASEVADAGARAARIRQSMGWSPSAREDRHRALAAEQVAESRIAREYKLI